MSNNPKFMVFHLKELIYTLTFIAMGIILIVLLILMFNGKTKEDTSCFVPGTYSTTLTLNEKNVEIELTVDKTSMKTLTLKNTDASIPTMYPLLEPAFEDLADQIISTQSTENLTYQSGSQYTYTLLKNTIDDLISSAKEQ